MLDELKKKISEIDLPKGATGLALFYDGRDGLNEWYICADYKWGTDGQSKLLELTEDEGISLSESKLVGRNTYGGFHNRKVFAVQ